MKKTYTIKPVFGNSAAKRILYWEVTRYGKVLHSSGSIYTDRDEWNYYCEMKQWIKSQGGTHIKHYVSGAIDKIDY